MATALPNITKVDIDKDGPTTGPPKTDKAKWSSLLLGNEKALAVRKDGSLCYIVKIHQTMATKLLDFTVRTLDASHKETGAVAFTKAAVDAIYPCFFGGCVQLGPATVSVSTKYQVLG